MRQSPDDKRGKKTYGVRLDELPRHSEKKLRPFRRCQWEALTTSPSPVTARSRAPNRSFAPRPNYALGPRQEARQAALFTRGHGTRSRLQLRFPRPIPSKAEGKGRAETWFRDRPFPEGRDLGLSSLAFCRGLRRGSRPRSGYKPPTPNLDAHRTVCLTLYFASVERQAVRHVPKQTNSLKYNKN